MAEIIRNESSPRKFPFDDKTYLNLFRSLFALKIILKGHKVDRDVLPEVYDCLKQNKHLTINSLYVESIKYPLIKS